MYSEEEVRKNEGELNWERSLMEKMLICEVKEWEMLFWKNLKVFLDHIGNDRVEEKERLTREWKADCWRRLNPQMHAALKRCTDYGLDLELFGEEWASFISRFFEGVEKPHSISLSKLRRDIVSDSPSDEDCLRVEKEVEDTEFRLNRGFDLGRFDLFWDHDSLFECKYSRSKWLYLRQDSTVPLEIYSHALKGNKNITHIAFSHHDSDSDVNRFQAIICDLP